MILALLAVLCGGVSLRWDQDSSRAMQYEVWLDPYDSAVNATRTLSDEPIPRLDTEEEGGVYWWLMRRLPFPRDVLLEASVNPLPVGGWALRTGYDGDLRKRAPRGWALVLRPNVEW